jgi:hypothetical protein
MKRICTAAAIFAAVMMVPAMAQTSWDGSKDTNWNEAENWSNGVPATGVAATIPSSCPRYPSCEGTGNTYTTGSLTIEHDATVTTNGNTLTIDSSNGLTIDPTSAKGDPGVLNISTNGIVVLSGGGTSQTVNGKVNLSGTLRVSSNCTMDGSGSIIGASGSYINVDSGVTLTNATTIKGALTIDETSGSTAVFTNGTGGLVHASAAGALNVATSTIGASSSGNWTVNVSGATLTLGPGADAKSMTGKFTVGNGGTLDIQRNIKTTMSAGFECGTGTVNVSADKTFESY